MPLLALALAVAQATRSDVPWQVVSASRASRVEVTSDGSAYLTADVPAQGSTLWDGLTGARVAAFDVPCVLEATGRYLVALHARAHDRSVLEELSVVDVRSGRTVARGLVIGEPLVGRPVARWSAGPPSEDGIEDGPWLGVRRFEVAGGTLTVHLPLARTAIATEVRLDVSADGRRALFQYDGGSTGRAVLVDPKERAPLAQWRSDGAARFSLDGRSVIDGVVDSDGVPTDKFEVLCVDAESGRRRTRSLDHRLRYVDLGAPPLHRLALDVTEESVFVTSGDRVHELPLPVLSAGATLEERRSVALLPPLAAPVPGSTTRLSWQGDVVVIEHRGEVHGYDATSGQLLWSRPAELAPTTGSSPLGAVFVRRPDGSVATLDTHDGEARVADRHGLATTERAAVFVTPAADGGAGPEVVLVSTAEGDTCAFDAASGATLGRSDVHRGRRVEFAAAPDGAGAATVATWDDAGRLSLLALPRLEERSRLELGADAEVLAASAGEACVLHAPKGRAGPYDVVLRSLASGEVRCTVALAGELQVLVSDGGTRAVLLADRRVVVVDLAAGAVAADFELEGERRGPSAAALHGEDTLVVARALVPKDEAAWYGVEVLDLSQGTCVARHRMKAGWFELASGGVRQIHSWPHHGRVVFTYTRDLGWNVTALDAATWREVASVELMHPLDPIAAPEGVAWAVVGQSVLDAASLVPLTAEALAALGSDPRALVRHSRVEVSSGAARVSERGFGGLTFTRWELVDGGALVQDAAGRCVLLDAPDEAPDEALRDVHVARGGASVPLASFLALRDERGRLALGTLPEPPWFVDGPPRVVTSGEGTLGFDVEAAGPRGAEAVLVRAEGREPQRVPLSPSGHARVIALGPWPLDLELLAVDAAGVTTRPWRLRVTAPGREEPASGPTRQSSR